MAVTVKRAVWVLVLEACGGDAALARRYCLSDWPLRPNADAHFQNDDLVHVEGGSLKDETQDELYSSVMELYGGDAAAAEAFLLRPHFGLQGRAPGIVANQSPEDLQMILDLVGQIKYGTYI